MVDAILGWYLMTQPHEHLSKTKPLEGSSHLNNECLKPPLVSYRGDPNYIRPSWDDPPSTSKTENFDLSTR